MEQILTANWKIEGGHTLDVYRKRGGYEAMKKAFKMDRKEIVELVKAAGVRMESSSFTNTGVNWQNVPRAK